MRGRNEPWIGDLPDSVLLKILQSLPKFMNSDADAHFCRQFVNNRVEYHMRKSTSASVRSVCHKFCSLHDSNLDSLAIKKWVKNPKRLKKFPNVKQLHLPNLSLRGQVRIHA